VISNLKKLVKNLIRSFSKSTQRFPETLAMAAGFVLVGIMLNRMEYTDTPEYLLEQARLNRWLLTFILGAPLFALGKLVLERLGESVKKRLVIDSILVALLAVFYQTIPEKLYQEFMVRDLLLNLAAYLGFLIAPYFYKRDNFSRYSLKVLTQFFITLFFSGVLYGGLNGIIFTLDQLFELNLNYRIYMDIYLITVGFFAVPHFLGNINPVTEDMDEAYYPQVWAILFSYIVIPLLSIYTLILYAYFIRLVVMREFPINILTHLVVWYGLISVVVLFFVEKLREKNDYLRRFHEIFPKAILLPLGLLFTAISARILDYGVTPARYFVVVAGIWILASVVYIGFSKKTRYPFVVLGAIVVVLVAAYGPLSAFNLSFNNQLERFESLLRENALLKEGAIEKNPELDLEVQSEISEFLRYFDNNHDQRQIDFLPEDFSYYEDTLEVFGFEHQYGYPSKFEDETMIEYYTFDRFDMVVPTSGEGFFTELNLEFARDSSVSGNEVTFEYTAKTEELALKYRDEVLGVVNVVELIEDYHEDREGIQPGTLEEATLTFEFPGAKVDLIIRNIFYNPSGEPEMKYGHFNGFVFLELK